MRPRPEMAVVTPEQTVGAALGEMTRHRAGAAVVVDAGDGRLAGIFTHGDFARHFQRGAAGLGERAVGEFMTRGPVSIGGDRLAVEILHLLEHTRIDDLVVVDGGGRPVGSWWTRRT